MSLNKENRHLSLVPTPENRPRSFTQKARELGAAAIGPYKELFNVFFPPPIELSESTKRQLEQIRAEKPKDDAWQK